MSKYSFSFCHFLAQDKNEPPLLDAAKAMSAVYFSYAETENVAPEGEMMAEEQQQLDAALEVERTAAAAARKEKQRKVEQMKLDRALG